MAAPTASGVRYVRGLHAWSGDAANGILSFSAGTRIEVVEEGDAGGWWRGRLDGVEGWFPSSYCETEEEPPGATVPRGGVEAGRVEAGRVEAASTSCWDGEGRTAKAIFVGEREAESIGGAEGSGAGAPAEEGNVADDAGVFADAVDGGIAQEGVTVSQEGARVSRRLLEDALLAHEPAPPSASGEAADLGAADPGSAEPGAADPGAGGRGDGLAPAVACASAAVPAGDDAIVHHGETPQATTDRSDGGDRSSTRSTLSGQLMATLAKGSFQSLLPTMVGSDGAGPRVVAEDSGEDSKKEKSRAVTCTLVHQVIIISLVP